MAVVFMHWTEIKRTLALVFLGFVLGLVVAMLLASSHIDSLISANERQKSQLSDLQERLEALEESLANRKNLTVKNLSVESNLKNKHLKLHIERYVKDLLTGLVGQELSEIDPLLTFKIVDGRTVTIEKQDYQLRVRALLLSESSVVILDVKPGKITIEE